MKKVLLLLMTTLLLAACGKTAADDSNELRISSASSLTEVMQAAENEFQKTHPEVKLVFNFGSSGKLRNQIEQGAPADLFLSASAKDMEILQKEDLVVEEVFNFAKNRLVLASANQLPAASLATLLMESDKMIAVGEPESVPVGFYTKTMLEQEGLWGPLEGKLIFAKDARQVLSYIESGNAEMGIVYASDTVRSSNIVTIVDLPQEGLEIVYPAGIVAGAKNKEAAKAFLAFLTSYEGQSLLEEYGFTSIEGAQR